MKGMITKTIEMKTKFSNFEVINPEFSRCRCHIYYEGLNRNGSNITTEATKKLISRKGYANVPVIGHLYEEDGKLRLGGHDRKIEMTEKGVNFINECSAFGCIPESCNPSMDTIIEKSGEKKDYFSTDIILWSHYFPIMEARNNDEVYFNQSMEIEITDYDVDDKGNILIKDFNLQALCLLNLDTDDKDKNVEPCFESSRVKRLSFGLNDSNFIKEFNKIDSEVNKCLNSKTCNKKGDLSMRDKIIEAFSNVKYVNSLGVETNKYHVFSITEDKVGVIDKEDGYKPYSFIYAFKDTENGENELIIDKDSKTEVVYSFEDKTEDGIEQFDFASELNTYSNSFAEKVADERVTAVSAQLNEKFEKDYEKLETVYNETKEALDVANSKLKVFNEKEAKTAKEKHEKEVKSLFSDYEDRLGRYAKYLIYKAKVEANCEEYELDEIKGELTLLVGEAIMSTESAKKKSSFSYTPSSSGVSSNGIDVVGKSKASNERYGSLLDAFRNLK